MIFQLSEFMHDQIFEIVTSRKEIGRLHETYAMFPYYLTGLVKSLAIGVSEVSVGAHELKAWIRYDGRAVVPKAPAEIGQWEICIGGNK